jgi:hypothetical protein
MMVQMTNQLRFSVLTLALILVAVIIFIYTGGSYLFYLVAVVAIIFGIVNFWMISKEPHALAKSVGDAAPLGLGARKVHSRRKRR